VIIIRDKQIRSAFIKVKKEIGEIRLFQESQSASFNSKLSTQINSLNDKFNSIISDLKSHNENSFDETKDILQELYETSPDKEKVNQELAKIQINLDILKKEFTEIFKSQKGLNDKLNLISNKLQEFENISVDVEDVENNFITRKEVDEIRVSIENITANEKNLKRIEKKISSFDNRLQDIEQNRHIYVQREHIERIHEDIADLKSNLVLKKDLVDMNNRIDNMEEKQYKKIKENKADLKSINHNIGDVFKLKKSFVTKEQFKNQRTEIRLLVQGLKDIQKIKTKLDKQKKTSVAKKKSFYDSIIEFFTEEESN